MLIRMYTQGLAICVSEHLFPNLKHEEAKACASRLQSRAVCSLSSSCVCCIVLPKASIFMSASRVRYWVPAVPLCAFKGEEADHWKCILDSFIRSRGEEKTLQPCTDASLQHANAQSGTSSILYMMITQSCKAKWMLY